MQTDKLLEGSKRKTPDFFVVEDISQDTLTAWFHTLMSGTGFVSSIKNLKASWDGLFSPLNEWSPQQVSGQL